MTAPRPSFPATLDASGMLAAIGAMGRHVREGYAAGREARDLPPAEGVRSVAFCGMGGSGIPGDLVRALTQDRLGVPVVVTKGYRLPQFCHTDTLLFAISYSGNTEETVTAYREALARGCRVVAIASGGELAALAGEAGLGRVAVPGGFPAPRAAVAFLVAAALGVMEAVEIAPRMGDDVEEAARVLEEIARENDPGSGGAEARELAAAIGPRVPVMWGSEGLAEAAAVRWKASVNENAKRPAVASAFPELDHNEIEGWSRDTGRDFFLAVLRAAEEHPSVSRRVEATLRAIDDAGLDHREVWARGDGALAQALSLVQLGDYVTAYLALDAGVDPTPISRIEALKSELEREA